MPAATASRWRGSAVRTDLQHTLAGASDDAHAAGALGGEREAQLGAADETAPAKIPADLHEHPSPARAVRAGGEADVGGLGRGALSRARKGRRSCHVGVSSSRRDGPGIVAPPGLEGKPSFSGKRTSSVRPGDPSPVAEAGVSWDVL